MRLSAFLVGTLWELAILCCVFDCSSKSDPSPALPRDAKILYLMQEEADI